MPERRWMWGVQWNVSILQLTWSFSSRRGTVSCLADSRVSLMAPIPTVPSVSRRSLVLRSGCPTRWRKMGWRVECTTQEATTNLNDCKSWCRVSTTHCSQRYYWLKHVCVLFVLWLHLYWCMYLGLHMHPLPRSSHTFGEIVSICWIKCHHR